MIKIYANESMPDKSQISKRQPSKSKMMLRFLFSSYLHHVAASTALTLVPNALMEVRDSQQACFVGSV